MEIYKMLIVDDEKIERDGIVSLIKKYKLPLLLYEANDGGEAINFLKSNNVDIVFTDIVMPLVNGIDLVKWVFNNKKKIVTIIYSAYGEFEYAQKALEVQVSKYILKPICPETFVIEMNEIISKCKKYTIQNEIEEKWLNNQRRAMLLKVMLYGNEFLTNSDLYKDAEYIMILAETNDIFFDKNYQEFANLCNQLWNTCETISINEYQNVIFIPSKNWKISSTNEFMKTWMLLNNFVNQYVGCRFYVALSNNPILIKNINAQFIKLKYLIAKKFFYTENCPFFLYEEKKQIQIEKDKELNLIESVNSYIEIKDPEGLHIALNKLSDFYIMYETISIRHIKSVFANFILLIINSIMVNDDNNIVEDIQKSKCISDIILIVESTFNAYNPSGNIKISKNSQLINKVLKIIEKDYSKSIGLDYLAESINITPGYLSTIFKKETGYNVLKYLNLFKLKKAKELIKNSNYKVFEISNLLGYSSPSYFIMQFKNYFGITPGEYAESIGNYNINEKETF